MYRFSQRSKDNLKEVDTRLVKLCYEVIQHIDFTVIEGFRSIERQQRLYTDGLSQVDGIQYLSKHNYKPALAIDVIPYEKGHNPFDGSDKSELMFYRLYREFQVASNKLNIPIEWGGFWSFEDYPHYQLQEV
jgi:peptidoglycan L-alanyl-D-glutamate endopeptidase CwlK